MIKELFHDCEIGDNKSTETGKLGSMIYRAWWDKKANKFGKLFYHYLFLSNHFLTSVLIENNRTRNSWSRPLKANLATVDRLYESQRNYDKRLEISKYLSHQHAMRYNKSPKVNSHSKSLLSKTNNWKPIYKRVDQVLAASSSNLDQK